MKNQLSLFVATLATLFITLTASAQGEWKWAHYWSGGDGSYGDYYNKIINTAFDDEGNIYVYGTMGGNAVFDGQTLQFVNNAEVLNRNERSILLAKFDILGNMLWYKVVKNSGTWSVPKWMEVRNNQIHISGDTGLDYVDWNWNNVWLYFLDTLITGSQVHLTPVENRHPPFQTGRWTFFTTLDTDGEVIGSHFVESFSRERILQGNEYIRYESSLCSYSGHVPTPIHTDFQGNTYIFTPIWYKGSEDDSLTIVVDGDSNKTYNLFLPGNVPNDNYMAHITNAILYKFSSSGELLFAKLLVNHTDGIASSYNLTGDSINKYFNVYYKGMSFDENDNMYLTGYVQLAECIVGQGGELHDYPVHVWWDSTHHVTINDISSADACNFVIKYDTDGNVVWCNQLYSRGNPSISSSYAHGLWNNVIEKNDSLYIIGTGSYAVGGDALIYFDNEENYLQRFQPVKSDIGFFVGYDAISGQYINHGIVPAAQAVMGKCPAVISNRLFAYSNVDGQSRMMSQWSTDGHFISSELLLASEPLGDGSIVANENGDLLLSCQATSPVNFGNNVSVSCPSGHSNAVVAFYHNPEFTTPFVPDDSVGIDEYYQNREREIYLYPNPTDGHTTVCGYMYGYRSIELLDLQGRKLATLLDSPHGTDVPEIDLSPYPSGTYLVKINFERGVSVVRKAVRSK